MQDLLLKVIAILMQEMDFKEEDLLALLELHGLAEEFKDRAIEVLL